MIIIPIKWLFHWEYTLFSHKPIWCHFCSFDFCCGARGTMAQLQAFHLLRRPKGSSEPSHLSQNISAVTLWVGSGMLTDAHWSWNHQADWSHSSACGLILPWHWKELGYQSRDILDISKSNTKCHLKNGRCCWRQHYKDNLFQYLYKIMLQMLWDAHLHRIKARLWHRSQQGLEVDRARLRCFNRFGQQVHFRTLWDKWSPLILSVASHPLFWGRIPWIPWQRHRSAPLAEEVRQLPLGLRGPQRSPYSALRGLAFHGLDLTKSIWHLSKKNYLLSNIYIYI